MSAYMYIKNSLCLYGLTLVPSFYFLCFMSEEEERFLLWMSKLRRISHVGVELLFELLNELFVSEELEIFWGL